MIKSYRVIQDVLSSMHHYLQCFSFLSINDNQNQLKVTSSKDMNNSSSSRSPASILRLTSVVSSIVSGSNPLLLTSTQRIASLIQISQSCFFNNNNDLNNNNQTSLSSTQKDFLLSPIPGLSFLMGNQNSNDNDENNRLDDLFNVTSFASPTPLEELLARTRGTLVGNSAVCIGFSLILFLIVYFAVLYKRSKDHQPICSSENNNNYKKKSSRQQQHREGICGCCSCLFGSSSSPRISRERRTKDRADRTEFSGYNFGRDSDNDDDDEDQNENQEMQQQQEKEETEEEEENTNDDETKVSYSYCDNLSKEWAFPSRWIGVFLFLVCGTTEAITIMFLKGDSSGIDLAFSIGGILLVLVPIVIFFVQLTIGTNDEKSKMKVTVDRKVPAAEGAKRKFFIFVFGAKSWDESTTFSKKYRVLLQSTHQIKTLFTLDFVSSIAVGVCSALLLTRDPTDECSLTFLVIPLVFCVLTSLEMMFICGCEAWYPFFSIFHRVFVLLLSLFVTAVAALILSLKLLEGKESVLPNQTSANQPKSSFESFKGNAEDLLKVFELIHAILCVVVRIVSMISIYLKSKVTVVDPKDQKMMNAHHQVTIHTSSSMSSRLQDNNDQDDDDQDHDEDEENDETPKRRKREQRDVDENNNDQEDEEQEEAEEEEEETEEEVAVARYRRERKKEDQQQQQKKKEDPKEKPLINHIPRKPRSSSTVQRHETSSAIDSLLSKLNPKMSSQSNFSLNNFVNSNEEGEGDGTKTKPRGSSDRKADRRNRLIKRQQQQHQTKNNKNKNEERRSDEGYNAKPSSPRVQGALSKLRADLEFI